MWTAIEPGAIVFGGGAVVFATHLVAFRRLLIGWIPAIRSGSVIREKYLLRWELADIRPYQGAIS